MDEYLIDLNGTRAYRVAYPRTNSDEAAAVGASRLLRKPNVALAIQNAKDRRSQRTEITQDRVLQEYARIAFLDPRGFFEDDGSVKKITDLDEDTAACLGGFEASTSGGPEAPVDIKKFKLIDKKGALDSLAKHLGMFNQDKSSQPNVIINANFGKKPDGD